MSRFIECDLISVPGHGALGLCGRCHDVLLGRLLVEHVAVRVHWRAPINLEVTTRKSDIVTNIPTRRLQGGSVGHGLGLVDQDLGSSLVGGPPPPL